MSLQPQFKRRHLLVSSAGLAATTLVAPGVLSRSSIQGAAPRDFVLPPGARIVAEVSPGSWLVDLGSNNGRARAFLGAALEGQSWSRVAIGLAGGAWQKNAIRTLVYESSMAPGAFPRLIQTAVPVEGVKR